MSQLIKKLLPPPAWRLPVIVVMGIFIGLAIYVFKISNAVSYLSDAPETCINCHVMVPQYATYQHSSHREHATCNDCHVPQDNFLNKYYFKAKDGLRHATMFTLRMEPQVIFIKEEGKKVVHDNCVRCHSDLLNDTKMLAKNAYAAHSKTDRECWECHREVPHGRVNSLSSTPFARIPTETAKYPSWLEKGISEQ
jgi:cytochrome c nitrite reductase small subunit